jgi:REP element-mobilizing transposase RayT
MRIFLDETDYRRFVLCFAQMIEDFAIECWSYCVMPNHYHATLRPTRANLSDAMQHLNSRYAQWWNRRYGKVGHVFQGRFKDQIVQEERYLLVLSRYIANNPVRAGLVKHPADWRWSSYAAIAGMQHVPCFLKSDVVLAQFGEEDRRLLQQRFAAYVCGSDDPEMEEQLRSPRVVLGDAAFRTAVPADGVRPGSDPEGSERGQTMV